ncbi:MAG: hypothetical protein LBM93_03000 [Oscillospiraceae bacterium]|jgi:hypothetical protein|nr:hypothetical protein [Oscillospiraceae bacterium]
MKKITKLALISILSLAVLSQIACLEKEEKGNAFSNSDGVSYTTINSAEDTDTTDYNRDIISKMGMTEEEITADQDDYTYLFSDIDYENSKVVEIEEIPFTTMFPSETNDVSINDFATKYGLKFIKTYYNGMLGIEKTAFYDNKYTISISGTSNNTIPLSSSVAIINHDYFVIKNYNSTEKDLENSKVKVFSHSNTYGVNEGMTVAEFLSDPVIVNLSNTVSREFCFMKNNEIISSESVIDTDMIVAIKDIDLNSQAVWTVIFL